MNHPHLYRNWIVNCAIGEFIGLGCAASVAVFTNQLLGEPQSLAAKITLLLLMVAGGMMEGFFISVFQWRVLHKVIPSLSLKHWATYTIAAAAMAWALGMLPNLLLNNGSGEAASIPPMGIIVLMGAGLGSILGTFMGFVQWLALKRYVAHSGIWIWTNALGWTVGMGIIMFGATWPDEHTTIAYVMVSAVSSGLLAGLSVGIFTGLSFRRFKLPPVGVGSISLNR